MKFVLLLLCLIFTSFNEIYASDPDTLFVTKGECILLNGSLIHVEKDTFYLRTTDSYVFHVDKDRFSKSKSFYDRVIEGMEKNRWGKEVAHAIFSSNAFQEDNDTIKEEFSSEEFNAYEGKTISKITIYKLNFLDQVNWKDVDRGEDDYVLDGINSEKRISTKDGVIAKSLLFKEGNKVDPVELADNERLLRELPYFQDARILVTEMFGDTSSVAVHVITQDIWPFAFNVHLKSVKENVISIYDNNIFGYGQGIESDFIINYDQLPSIGLKASWVGRNLFGSFIDSRLIYFDAFSESYTTALLSKSFVSNRTKYAGGIKFSNRSILQSLDKPDTIVKDQRLRSNELDVWLGRSFRLRKEKYKLTSNPKIVIANRFNRVFFYARPKTSSESNIELHDKVQYLASIAFTQQNYYKSKLLYGFGSTEDIPVGTLIQFIGGYEKDEFFGRTIGQLNVSGGRLSKRFGYLYGDVGIGGFYNEGIEQGIFKSKIVHASSLHSYGRYKIRQFSGIRFTKGFRRFEDEKIEFTSKNIRGFSSQDLYGLQKLSLNLETVFFSPHYLYDFRFVFYAFADVGFIGRNSKNIFKNQLYSGIGLGIRSRNDNLAFNTLSVRFSFYPVSPVDANLQNFVISGEQLLRANNFNVRKPELLKFE